MMYCIGVGDANEEELSIIASRPASSHVLHVRDYQAIEYLRNIVASRTCKGRKGSRPNMNLNCVETSDIAVCSENFNSSCKKHELYFCVFTSGLIFKELLLK